MVAQSDPLVAVRNGVQPRLPFWVKAVIGLCCVMQVAVMAGDLLGYPILRQALMIFGGFWSPVVWAGHGIFPGHILSIFVTYGFLHAGLLHLGMNMLSLVAIARAWPSPRALHVMSTTMVDARDSTTSKAVTTPPVRPTAAVRSPAALAEAGASTRAVMA